MPDERSTARSQAGTLIVLGLWFGLVGLVILCVVYLETQWISAGWRGPGGDHTGRDALMIWLAANAGLVGVSTRTIGGARVVGAGIIAAAPLALALMGYLFLTLIINAPAPPPRIVRPPAWYYPLVVGLLASPALLWIIGPLRLARARRILPRSAPVKP